jgi:hypothetical protein
MLKKVLKQWLQTATLLASLDKSILQIRDWLTLLEDMLKKEKVDLSDLSHICHLLERQRVSTLIEFCTSLPDLDFPCQVFTSLVWPGLAFPSLTKSGLA